MKLTNEVPYFLYIKEGKPRLIRGSIEIHDSLAGIPRPTGAKPLVSVSMIPFCQIKEQGFPAHDGGEKIITLVGNEIDEVRVEEIFPDPIPEVEFTEDSYRFNCDETSFAEQVQAIIGREIRNGEGSNFLLSRKLFARIQNFDNERALAILDHLIKNEFGAYWNFCFFDGNRYFLGSSPERHLTYSGDEVEMNPICGTLPKSKLVSKEALLSFLNDKKEINELFQVLDEELKMMAKICRQGGNVEGPFLKEMRSLIHTEYLLHGISSLDKIDAFRLSMFAPTMIGSPLENAARIIHKYETESRGYYSGAVMILDLDENGAERLDSAITIRTAEIGRTGDVVLQAGASLVWDSDPLVEVAEVDAKYTGLLKAIGQPMPEPPILERFVDPEVHATLHLRNRNLSTFWMKEQQSPRRNAFRDRDITIIDNEDEFTFMLTHILSHLNYRTKIIKNVGQDFSIDDDATVIIGPGPGDPTNVDDPRIDRIHQIIRLMLLQGRPFLAICLGHQVLASVLGFSIVKLDPPLQGIQRKISLFERDEIVGFYNSFSAKMTMEEAPSGVEVSYGEGQLVNALRAKRFHSFQFHPESVLTRNGLKILEGTLEAMHGAISR